MVRLDKGELPVGLAEMQAYVRVETGEEEALLAGMLRVAAESCETFCNQVFMARAFETELTASDGWCMLHVQPVRLISGISEASTGSIIDLSQIKVDIDHDRRAFINGLRTGTVYRVAGVAGLASERNDVPEPLRQGMMRLAAALFANRDSGTGELPRDVTALWRPYRKAGLAR
jgi:uncharacterized phiE125 gp8 family phage protein